MGVDGIFLHFLKNEIADYAVGAKIEKIFMPSKYELVFNLRTRAEARRLFFSVGGNAPRFNFTAASPENPAQPPMLCMLLRKQLTGAVIRGVRQAGLDRIVFFDMDAADEIGDRVKRTLAVEIMAQYSNAILLDENGVVIDALKRVDATKSSFREVLPKLPYRLPPPQDKYDIREVSPEQAVQRIVSYENKALSSALLNTLSGVSPLIARELAYRVTLGDPAVSALSATAKERLLYELDALKTLVEAGKAQPCWLTDANGAYLDFSYLPLTLYANDAQRHSAETLSEILDQFYFEREKLRRAKSKAEDLFKSVAALKERTAKKVNVQREELAACADREQKRVWAELINANLYSLEKGASVYEVQDYYNDYQTVAIPVDPLLTPSQNSQRYYKEYRKAQTAQKILTEQIEKGMADLAYLETVEDELSRAETEKELTEIRFELSGAGMLKSRTGTKNKKNAPLPPLRFTSPNGFPVLVGRNNTQNDELSFKKAAKNDWWFHAQKAPGSHVILVCSGEEAPEEDMEFAAKTAAWFSSVRERGTVEVDYTRVKNLKKPPAARPGYVIYHVYQTVYARAEKPQG
ncbi:MAG: NFACT family protein [Clostridia bacterium]|nr:NFACT family protein [Clostridia bacterium]